VLLRGGRIGAITVLLTVRVPRAPTVQALLAEVAATPAK
jgi:hypothetical protein